MSTEIPLSTYLALDERLPLTCTRAGVCCFKKMVWLNPWELARMAAAKGVTSREFRDRYCDYGGIRLRFDGELGWRGLEGCSQYLPERGCSIYHGRPLVCRLYPLGRERRGVKFYYLHRESTFPCLEVCPEVKGLPFMTVADYLEEQDVSDCERALDSYLELMQHLADGAFALLLESGLSATGDRSTLRLWRSMGKRSPEKLAEDLGEVWIDRLLLPESNLSLGDPAGFANMHYTQLQSKTQELFGCLEDVDSFHSASGLMMGLALHLGRGLGANPADLAARWITTAKEHGARE